MTTFVILVAGLLICAAAVAAGLGLFMTLAPNVHGRPGE